jgi:hypothetical protein
VLEKTGLHPTEMGSGSSTVIAVLNGMEPHFTRSTCINRNPRHYSMVLTVASQQHRRGVLNRARSGGFPEDTITFPAGSPVSTGRVEGCSCAIDDLRKREDRVMGRASARVPRLSSLHYRQWRREPFVDRDERPGRRCGSNANGSIFLRVAEEICSSPSETVHSLFSVLSKNRRAKPIIQICLHRHPVPGCLVLSAVNFSGRREFYPAGTEKACVANATTPGKKDKTHRSFQHILAMGSVNFSRTALWTAPRYGHPNEAPLF